LNRPRVAGFEPPGDRLGLFNRQLWSAWLLGAVFSAQDRFERGVDENLCKSTVFACDG